jgi:uncharacterized protein YpmB
VETCIFIIIIVIIIIIIIIYPSSYSINIWKHALIMVATREKLHTQSTGLQHGNKHKH